VEKEKNDKLVDFWRGRKNRNEMAEEGRENRYEMTTGLFSQ
jgi:hypothetical protein